MQRFILAFALFCPLLAARTSDQDGSPSALNVNSRYTVESIGFSQPNAFQTSRTLASQMQRLIGERLNVDALNDLARRIMADLHAQHVSFRLARGVAPEHVRVVFEVERPKGVFDVAVPKVVYRSDQGFSGTGDITATFGANRFTLGGTSDADQLIERFSGVSAKYERTALGSDRLRFSLEFDDYRIDYDRATVAALAAGNSGLNAYGMRRNLEPALIFALSPELTFASGFSFNMLSPSLTAARPLSSNTVINSLRYRRDWETTDTIQQHFAAGYTLRAATHALGSNTTFTRHLAAASYSVKLGSHLIEANASAGYINGGAPLFERFSLGNSAALQGWNKYEIDPLGGDRLAYASVGYGYHVFRAFYDAGSVWDRGKTAETRQSVGAGFKKDAFFLAVAFPLRGGRVDPVFLAGMNY